MEHNENQTDKEIVVEPDIFICQCNSIEHQMIVWYDEQDNELYAEMHLTTERNFWERLKAGIRYAFGYKSQYGDWDEFLFKNDDIPKLKKHLNKVALRNGKK
ncbi:MAG: hypothetical protein ACOC2W_03835 [bacterium]